MRVCVALVWLTTALSAQTLLRGTVTDMAGAAAADVLLTATPDSGAASVTRMSVAGGAFIFTGLAPGTYSLTTNRDPTIRRVQLDAGQDTVLDLAVPANPTISGRVLDSGRIPVKDARVWLLIPEFRHGVLTVAYDWEHTDDNGEYTFSRRVESYRRYYLMAFPPSGPLPPPDAVVADRQPIEIPTYYPSAARFDAAAPIILQPGEQRARLDIVLESVPYFCVDGKIEAATFSIEEAAIPGVHLFRANGQRDQDGNYRTCGLPAGSYRLVTSDGSTSFTITDTDVHQVDLVSATAHLQMEAGWDREPTLELSPPAEAALRALTANLGESDPATIFHRIGPGAFGDQQMLQATVLAARDAGESGMIALLDEAKAANYIVSVKLSGTSNAMTVSTRVGFPRPVEVTGPAGEYALDIGVSGEHPAHVREVTYNGVVVSDPVVQLAPGSSGTLANLAVRTLRRTERRGSRPRWQSGSECHSCGGAGIGDHGSAVRAPGHS